MYHDVPAYPTRPDGSSLCREFDKCLTPTDKGLPGDVVVFWILRPELPSHTGILTDYGLIHTHSGVGKVVEHVIDERWEKRIHRYYQYPNLDLSWPS